MSVAVDPKTREQMGWHAKFDEWQSIKSTLLSKKLRAKDIQPKSGSGGVSSNGSFQAIMLEALKIKEDDMARPNDNEIQLLPKKWEGTMDRA